jgi:hypothetical protein
MTRTGNRIAGVDTVTTEAVLWRLDPDIDALFSDVDEIVCAAPAPRPRPPRRPVPACGTRDHEAPGPVSGRTWIPTEEAHAAACRATQRAPPSVPSRTEPNIAPQGEGR